MEKLENCPNCGGFIDDFGRCEFCGSKVYDRGTSASSGGRYRMTPAEKCEHVFVPSEWKIYEEPIKGEIHVFNVCRKCRMRYAMAYPKEEFTERFGSNDYSSIIKAIVADINKNEVRNDN